MKITSFETRIVEYLYPEPIATAWTPGQAEMGHGFTLLKIVTEDGHEGHSTGLRYRLFASARDSALDRGGVNGPLAKPAVDAFLHQLLIGRDATNIEGFLQTIQNTSYFGRGRFWFVEMALWDILGKKAGLPVYKLLGGFQDRIKGYASWATTKTPEAVAEAGLLYKDIGYRAIKMRVHADTLHEDIAQVTALRRAVGDDFDIMVDANYGRAVAAPGAVKVWDVARAVATARELEHLGVFWLEEPLHQSNLNGLAELRSKTGLRIAGGEYNENVKEFATLLNAFDIFQPDAVRAGGVFATRKIGALAEAFNKFCILHTWGDGLLMHPSLHVAASMPNCPYFEMPDERPSLTPQIRDKMLLNPVQIDPDGFVTLPQDPGMGMQIDWDMVQRLTVA
jgi:D-galactarolactone cycloisomerase